jgi:hypothetical protein
MRLLRIVLLISMTFVLGAAAAAQDLELTVREDWGQGGIRHVTGGIPLLPGQAKDVTKLRLYSLQKGEKVAVPAQFRVLARWWRADDSIRWVLADFTAPMRASEKKTYFLRVSDDPAPAAAPAVSVEEKDDKVIVITGPARFVVDRKKFAFLDAASVDANSDGEFSEDENLLDRSPDLGTVMEDTYGTKYFSSGGTKTVEVLESGPVRACVRARGVHRARDGGYSKGMYGYDCIMHFYAGSSAVFVDYVITNNPKKSRGAPTFEDASLLLRLHGGASGYTIYGAGPLGGKLAEGESVRLYQDSNGAETWKICQGYWGRKANTVSFRGYRIDLLAGDKEERITGGDHARGVTHIFNDRGGFVLSPRHFWQQFPKAVQVSADGTLRVGLFPKECVVPHFLEDASAKGHELLFLFYAKGRKTGYAGGDRPVPHVVADIWNYPVYPRCSLEHYAACGALADMGVYSVPTLGLECWPLEVWDRRYFTNDYMKGNSYGWQVFGSRWDKFRGHSPWARQPIDSDNQLMRYVVTGHRSWLEQGMRRARNFRDVRAYRVEDQNPFSFTDWKGFRSHNRSEEYCGRPVPKDEEAKKYSQGTWARFPWLLPNPSHMTMDLIYDRYLMTGDVRCFENMKIIAGHGGAYAAFTKPRAHRLTGWSWRACTRYWELTGDKECWGYLDKTLENYRPLYEREAPFSASNKWFYEIFCRAVAQTAFHSRDERAHKLCIALARGREKHAGYHHTLFAYLYHATGDEKHKRAILDDREAESMLNVTRGYLPACSHYIIHQ